MLANLDDYRRHFMDVDLWRPHVAAACRRHGLAPCDPVRAGLAGTYPTFVVADRWVVKFFGRVFAGATAFETELEVARLLAKAPAIPAPAIVASGRLFEAAADWPWPYLIFEFVPGVSVGEVYAQISLDDRLALARWTGAIMRELHTLPFAESTLFRPTWDAYRAFLEERRARCVEAQRAWGALPDRLLAQIEAFVPPVESLIDPHATPHLIHADITCDHVLGRLEGGRWTTAALIDYGDAMVADLAHELLAVHLSLFACDKRLLRTCLDAYGLDAAARRRLPAQALSLMLLSPYDLFGFVFAGHPQAREAMTLEELGAWPWDLGAPGLGD